MHNRLSPWDNISEVIHLAKKKNKATKPTNPANLSQKNDMRQISVGFNKRGGQGSK